MPNSMISSAAPVLPLPRQPSPLSFNSITSGDAASRPGSAASSSDAGKSQTHGGYPDSLLAPAQLGTTTPHLTADERARIQKLLPSRPCPDSMTYRSALSQLESKTVALKRLLKTVLHSYARYATIALTVASAEDTLHESIMDLARYLANAFEDKSGLWNDDPGKDIRVVRREQRRRELEDLDNMVALSVDQVRLQLKRSNLAGGDASQRYEKSRSHYYHQTGTYLNPANHAPPDASSHSVFANILSPSSPEYAAIDLAQGVRTCQFGITSYEYHSTLLQAAPPSSLSCADLLVSLTNWAGSIIGESPPREQVNAPTDHTVPSGVTSTLRSAVAASLTKLADTRSALVQGWAMRDAELEILKDTLSNKELELIKLPVDSADKSTPLHHSGRKGAGPISSAMLEQKRLKKMHKIQRSVGGRLRDLLSTSTSSHTLSNSATPTRHGQFSRLPDNTPRASVDTPRASAANISNGDRPSAQGYQDAPTPGLSRPYIASRHSLHIPTGEYVSPVLGNEPRVPSPLDNPFSNAPPPVAIGIAGMAGADDEDELRELVGRKKEGVLWAIGDWEDMTKATGRKVEMMWVVLDHCTLYEYRTLENGQMVPNDDGVDLKFASVRDARGSNRRFAFEIISHQHGRRTFQAPSYQEMRMWIYAFANAIEASINGTSTVRAFDTSKLRTVSGSLDDHAVPTGSRQHAISGLGLPLPTIPQSPTHRRSTPPTNGGAAPVRVFEDVERRMRKTSFKKVFKQTKDAFVGGVSKSSPAPEFTSPRTTHIHPPPLVTIIDSVGNPSRLSASTTTSASTDPISSERLTPPPPSGTGSISSPPSSGRAPDAPDRESWYEDGDIERRVNEMVGLGHGPAPAPTTGSSATRRIQSDGAGRLAPGTEKEGEANNDMSRTRSADAPQAAVPLRYDAKDLREIASIQSNTICADCKKGLKSSRWATTKIRNMDIVLFLCIRCVGIHRALGVEISRPRSVDMDNWSPATIALASEWGNARGNGIWEEMAGSGYQPNTPEAMETFISAKYRDGKWLSEANKLKYGYRSGELIGTAI